jgi:hypothetical protein
MDIGVQYKTHPFLPGGLGKIKLKLPYPHAGAGQQQAMAQTVDGKDILLG